ncbi:hypothetical protein Nepgr_014553 [Nepenthes gracilis]|uniref:Uncharacterized protein n=1 Tax=Nepenthes gracilis TaxID=150966 RepID=A0AAD3SK90_NEPGR|nr:hypothetical protein Nepgr_014553 [Nepenthes gracilis]
MDACEAKEEFYSNTAAVNTLKPPLVPAEKNNGVTTRRSRTREIGSRGDLPPHLRRLAHQHRFKIVTVEKTLYRVWRTNLSLWDFVITKRIDLQKLQLELKLNLVLNEQLAYLEDWDLLERDHSTCLTGVIKDLEINPLRHLLSQLAGWHFLSNCKSVMSLTNNRFEYSNTAPQIPNRLALYILRQ